MRIARILAVVLCSVGSSIAAYASEPEQGPATSNVALTRGDVEAWLDGFLEYELQRGDIAGGVVENLTRGGQREGDRLPEFVLDILRAGGLRPMLKARGLILDEPKQAS